MKKVMTSLLLLLSIALVVSCDDYKSTGKGDDLGNVMVRMAEIEVDPNYVTEYRSILQEEAEASVRQEAGVICVYPMLQKGDSTQVRILEIYASEDAYNVHLKSPHFIKYKTSTAKMVKSMRLIDMEALDSTTMAVIFGKLQPKLKP